MAKVVKKGTKVATKRKVSPFKKGQEVVVYDKDSDAYYYAVVDGVKSGKIKVIEEDNTEGLYAVKDVTDKVKFEVDNAEEPDEEKDVEIEINIDDEIDSKIVEENEDENLIVGEEEMEVEIDESTLSGEEVLSPSVVEEGNDEPKSWFAIGDSKDADFKGPQSQTFRVWMPQDNIPREFTIITPEPFTCKEHAVKMSGSFRNYFTCIAPMGERCPIDEDGNRPYVVKAFYVIDHTPYEDKAGKKHKDQLRLLVFKQSSYKVFRSRLDNYFKKVGKEVRYLGVRFAATRTEGDKIAATGNIFDILKVVKVPDKLMKTMEEIQEEFTPLTRNALLQQIGLIEQDDK